MKYQFQEQDLNFIKNYLLRADKDWWEDTPFELNTQEAHSQILKCESITGMQDWIYENLLDLHITRIRSIIRKRKSKSKLRFQRKVVSVSQDTYDLLLRLQYQLTQESGKKPTFDEVLRAHLPES